MTEIIYGVYWGSYNATINHTYLVPQLVYTDNTYATIDTSRSPASDSFLVSAISVTLADPVSIPV